MGGEKANILKFDERLQRSSRNPSKPPEGVKERMSGFKILAPPEVRMDDFGRPWFEIPVKSRTGEALLLDIRKFFGEDTSRFILNFGDIGISAEVAGHLFEINKNFNNDKAFDELVGVVKKIFNVCGHTPVLEFVHNIAFESQVGWKKEAFINVMPAFGSEPIIRSFELFATGPSKHTVLSAAKQLAELGYRLKERSAIENIGKVITHLHEKFDSMYITLDFRSNLMTIAKHSRIPDENKAVVVNAICDKLLEAKTEREVEELNQDIATHLERENPQVFIMGEN